MGNGQVFLCSERGDVASGYYGAKTVISPEP